MEKYSLELYHHGTKGMKWGKRLYQHKDGSLTALGRLRYGKKGAPDSKEKKPEDIEAKKQKVLASRSAKSLDKNAHLFDDQELNRAYQRLSLEKRIRELEPPKEKKFEVWTGKFNRAADLMVSGAKFYDSIAKIRNTFSKTGKPWPLIGSGGKKDDKKKDDKDDKKKEEKKDDPAYESSSYKTNDVSWVNPNEPFSGLKNLTRDKHSGSTTKSGGTKAPYDIDFSSRDPYISILPSFDEPVSFITSENNVERGRNYIRVLTDKEGDR